MLDMFRSKGLQSAIYGILIVATVIVFVVQFNPSAGKKAAKLTQTCAATVRGECIEPKDHKAAFMLLVPYDRGTRLVGQAKKEHIPQLALDGLVERELLVGEAHRIGLTVTDNEINDTIISGILHVSLPADKQDVGATLQPPVIDGRRAFGLGIDPKTKEFDEKIYARNLKNVVGESEVEFRQFEEHEILAAKMRDLVRAPVRVSEAEALESYLTEKSSATFTMIDVRPAFVARYSADPVAGSGAGAPMAVTDAEVEAWAKKPENGQLVAQTLEARKKSPPKDGTIRYILVKVAPNDDAAAHAKALAKITEAFARIQRGEPFPEVAHAISEDSNKDKGGSTETDKADALPPAIAAAATKLKNGETTQTAIESQLGYSLVARDDSSRLAKDVAREIYFKSRAHDAARDFAAKIAAAIKGGKSPDDAIKGELASLKPIPFIKVTADATLQHKKPAAADAGVATAGDAGVATATDAGAPKKTEPPPTALDPTKDDDRPQALTSNAIRRGGETLPNLPPSEAARVLDFAFKSKDGDLMEQPVAQSTGGYYVLQLKSHKLATADDFKKDGAAYTDQLLRARRDEALAVYMKRLLDAARADIHKDEAYMSEWTGDAGAGSDDDEP